MCVHFSPQENKAKQRIKTFFHFRNNLQNNEIRNYINHASQNMKINILPILHSLMYNEFQIRFWKPISTVPSKFYLSVLKNAPENKNFDGWAIKCADN